MAAWVIGAMSPMQKLGTPHATLHKAFINRGLNAERPVVILSENSLEHALLALGCMVAGVPFVPTSPPYSLISQDYDKLKHVLRTVTPGLGVCQRCYVMQKPLQQQFPATWKL